MSTGDKNELKLLTSGSRDQLETGWQQENGGA